MLVRLAIDLELIPLRCGEKRSHSAPGRKMTVVKNLLKGDGKEKVPFLAVLDARTAHIAIGKVGLV